MRCGKPNTGQHDCPGRCSSFSTTSRAFPALHTFTKFHFHFLLLVVITVTPSWCQSAKLCMQPLITLNRLQPLKPVPTRSMLPSATCFLKPAPIHALRPLRHSPNLYSPLRASSWLLMRSYLSSILHDLRLVESLVLVASSAGTLLLTCRSLYTLLFSL